MKSVNLLVIYLVNFKPTQRIQKRIYYYISIIYLKENITIKIPILNTIML